MITMPKNISHNKDIFESKLSITTNCILRCKYCFVDKPEKTQMMDFKTAKAAIDLILLNGPKDKIIRIYGGEPLLNFGLLPKLMEYIKKKKSPETNLTISLCTNAVLLKPKHIDFFKENNFQLAISLDGRKETHDKFRRFKDGRGTFEIVLENLKPFFRKISKRNAAANITVNVSEVSKLFDNFKYILSQGFDTANVEPIYGFKNWTKKYRKEFENQLRKIIDYIIKGILKEQFIFLTTVNRELRYKTLSRLEGGVCLFDQFLEVYPNGEIGLSSFFLNLPLAQRKKYIIGNVSKGELDNKYRFCEYQDGDKCQRCLMDYFDIPDDSRSSKNTNRRNLISIETAQYLEKMGQKNNLFKKYIKEAKKHICF